MLTLILIKSYDVTCSKRPDLTYEELERVRVCIAK